MPTEAAKSSLFRLLQLASPSLPVGAYAYSQGLEYAVQANWVHDVDSCRDWLFGICRHNLAYWDLPVGMRIYRAWQNADSPSANYWNKLLWAGRESVQLQAQERQMAKSLLKLLAQWSIPMPQRQGCPDGDEWCFVTVYMFAARYWGIDRQSACQAWLWSWLENMVLAAVKLIPLGQTAGQNLLLEAVPLLSEAMALAATLRDDELGASLPAVAMACAKHETLYSRLFRS